MKLLSALLSVSVCLFIHLAGANWAPCQPAEFTYGYSVFLKRHLSSDTPDNLNYNDWEAYLKRQTDCDRSLQSFLSPPDRDKVEDVCTPTAGKQQRENYCISKNKFTFISVQSELSTCIVKNVTRVTQHIILACDMVHNVCRPTQLEENKGHLEPREQDADCVKPTEDHGFMIRAADRLCLLLTLLGLAFCYLMG
ncbi:uncharacterized protein LOC144541922 [Centroberyx gerrardi]